MVGRAGPAKPKMVAPPISAPALAGPLGVRTWVSGMNTDFSGGAPVRILYHERRFTARIGVLRRTMTQHSETAPSGVLSLTTDFGSRDHYVAAMKAVIAGIAPAVRVIDVS